MYMDQNKKIGIFFAALILIIFSYHIHKGRLESHRKKRVESNLKLEFENFEGENTMQILDVNLVTQEDLLRRGISMNIAKKILEYRSTVGYVEKIADLDRVSGIGKKTVEKLTEILEVVSVGKRKSFNINKANLTVLKYYGFTKKEIKQVEKWKNEHGEIYSNIELKEVLRPERYEEYKKLVRYQDYD